MKDFKDIINSPLMKTSGVIRYSGLLQAREETLSEHILDVMNISYLMSREVERLGTEVDLGLLLPRALVHDCDEVLIGDIPRLTKYSSDSLYSELDNLASITANSMSMDIDGTTYTYDLWANAKVDDVEGTIIRMADMLSVANKVINEVVYGANIRFIKVAYELSQYVDQIAKTYSTEIFTPEANAYLSALLVSVVDLMTQVQNDRPANSKGLDLLNSIQKSYIDNHIEV